MRDAQGNVITEEEARALLAKSRRLRSRGRSPEPVPQGYIAPPGTGPNGETCKTCRHLFRNRMAKTYLKCDLTNWTRGRKTDVLAGSPACSKWEAAE